MINNWTGARQTDKFLFHYKKSQKGQNAVKTWDKRYGLKNVV